MLWAGPEALKPWPEAPFRPGPTRPTHRAHEGLGPGLEIGQAQAQGSGPGFFVSTSVKPVDSPNEQTMSRDQGTGTTVESGSGADMQIMSGSNPHVHDDAQCEVRGLSGSANDCEDDKESRKGASADGKLPEPADATNEPEGSAGVGESCKGCQWVGRDGERGDERHQHTDKTRQRREQSTNVPYDSPEPPWPPDIPTNHASEPTTRQEASIEGENGHVGARTINDRGREKEVRASRWKSRRTKRRCCHGQDAATSAARCESKRLETDALAGYKASQHGKHNRTTADVPEVSKPPHNHHRSPTDHANPPRRRGKLKTRPKSMIQEHSQTAICEDGGTGVDRSQRAHLEAIEW
ncbi:hypothetical protein EV363DRAFT_1536807 [Boletus edulis]|nr:hypothetical protein EV363DRAFT_1536807 [Boletus edulis]